MSGDPLVAKARHHRILSGLSQAVVYLLTEDGTTYFVRKGAADAGSSARLRRQMGKQIAFGEQMAGIVRTPAVLAEGMIDDRYYFDMEFISGTDGASFLRQGSIPDIQGFAGTMRDYLAAAASLRSGAQVDPYPVLQQRVAEAQSRTRAMDDELYERLMRLLESLRQIGPLPETLCHGDLTLENMLVDRRGSIWLVDLLDSPIEHYWQDVAKLHQDLSGGWYLRRVAPISRSVLSFVSRAVLDATNACDPSYALVHRALLVCTFVRILPYARLEADRRMILERVEHFTSDRYHPEITP